MSAPARWHPALWIAGGLILLIPAIAMQFTREVDWTASDFAAGALMLSAAALAIEAIFARIRSRKARLAGVLAVLAALLLIWAQGAVGTG